LDEVFGLVVTEAMASGIPVVGFAVGGIPEQVAEGCGRLVPPRDAKALGQAITALLEDNELRHTMGERCREKAVRDYDQKRFVERHLALYHKLIEGVGS
jgi:glycosyltransferase involved in cell wall biosynthesis